MDDKTYKCLMTQALGRTQSKIKNLPFKCIYSKCNSYAIKSHSQQKFGQLRCISEGGQVYALQSNHYQAAKMGQGAPFLILKGIKEASTFMGFCSEHDKAIFKPIELRPLEQDDPEQALVFYIRSICYEYAQKRRSFEFAGNLLEELSSFGDPGFISELEGMKEMKSEWLKKDWPYYSEFAFSSLANGDFSNLRTVWRVVDKNIGISNCCIYAPLLDDHDRYMEENWDLPQPANSFNLVPTVAQTHVITSWIGNCVADSNWVIEEKNTNKGLEVYINRCGFAESADICLRPSLWESLSFEKRREAEFAMAPNFIRGPLDPIPIIIEI